MRRPDQTVSCLLALSLNWVMRVRSPKGVRVVKTQASSVCSGTWDWTKRVTRSGLSPAAMFTRAASKVRWARVEGS